MNMYLTSLLVLSLPLVNSLSERPKFSAIRPHSSKYLSTNESSDDCVSNGTIYPHGANLNRSDDPCERCFCYKGTTLCWNIHCPTSSDRQGCKEIRLKELCCPVLECPILIKDSVFPELSARQPRLFKFVSDLTKTPKEITCKVGHETYKVHQKVHLNNSIACQQCICGSEGRIICKLTPCREPNQVESPRTVNNNNETDSEDNSVFSTKTVPDSVIQRVTSLFNKISTDNLTAIDSEKLNPM